MIRGGFALLLAVALAIGVVVSCGGLSGGDPAGRTTGSRSPAASRTATHTPKPAAKHTPKPGSKPSPKPVARVNLTGTGSRKSKPIVLAGNYVLRDSIVTMRGCHWRVFLDGYDTAPIDEVLTNATGSTSNEVALPGLVTRRYTLRVVASSCGRWSVSLGRA